VGVGVGPKNSRLGGASSGRIWSEIMKAERMPGRNQLACSRRGHCGIQEIGRVGCFFFFFFFFTSLASGERVRRSA